MWLWGPENICFLQILSTFLTHKQQSAICPRLHFPGQSNFTRPGVLLVHSYSAPTGAFAEAIAETQKVWEKWDFSMTWPLPLKYGLMQLHFDKTSVCMIQEYMKSWGFFFPPHFSSKPLQGSGIHHFPSFLPAPNDKPQQMAVTDTQPRVSAVNPLQQREPPGLNLVFSTLRGTRGSTGPPCPKGAEGPAQRHLQMCAMAGTTCRTRSLHKWIISGCKSAGWRTVITITPPQMPKCALATWFLEKADAAGEDSEDNKCSGCQVIWTHAPNCERFSFIYLAKLGGPITKNTTSDDTLKKSLISLHRSHRTTSRPAKQTYWQERQNLAGERSSCHQVTYPKGSVCSSHPFLGRTSSQQGCKLWVSWCKLLKTAM